MKKNNQKFTSRGQTLIELACIIIALLIWLVLLTLGGQITEVFFYILIAYHVIGGIVNRDIAANIIVAILLAPVYIGRKIALYIQTIQISNNFENLTKDDLASINGTIVDILKTPRNKEDKMQPFLFGCATYGDLEELNKRIVQAYNKQ